MAGLWQEKEAISIVELRLHITIVSDTTFDVSRSQGRYVHTLRQSRNHQGVQKSQDYRTK